METLISLLNETTSFIQSDQIKQGWRKWIDVEDAVWHQVYPNGADPTGDPFKGPVALKCSPDDCQRIRDCCHQLEKACTEKQGKMRAVQGAAIGQGQILQLIIQYLPLILQLFSKPATA